MDTFTPASFINQSQTIDFRIWQGEIVDQGVLNSCTGRSTENYCEATAARLGKNINLSGMEIWYEARVPLGGQNTNSGSTISIALDGASDGVPSEGAWPYDYALAFTQPSQAAESDGQNFKVMEYKQLYLDPNSQIARESMIKSAMAQGYMVLLETNVNNQFAYEHRSLSQQIYTNPDVDSPYANYGRHALNVNFYGLPGTYGSPGCENSWSPEWGDHGNGLIHSNWYSDKAYIITKMKINGIDYDFNFTEHRVQVNQLYPTLFGRAADCGGLKYWESQLDNGASFAQVAQDMFNCEPARVFYPAGSTNGQIVDALYSNALGRASDAEGHAYWQSKLDSGHTVGSVVVDLITAVAHYSGADPVALAAQNLFENRVMVSAYNSIMCADNNLSIAYDAMDHVTSDANSVGDTYSWLAGQLQDHGWA